MHNFGKLRAIADDELELMRSWRNAPQVRANMFTRHEISQEEHLAWWQRIKARDDQCYYMYEQQGQPLGIVAFNAINPADRHSLWALYAAPAAPRGTGTFMELLALDQAFGPLHLHKLSCEVLAFNAGVIKLHLKFGFRQEGILRAQHNVDGTYIDIHRFGILADEWQQQRPALLAKLEKLERH